MQAEGLAGCDGGVVADESVPYQSIDLKRTRRKDGQVEKIEGAGTVFDQDRMLAGIDDEVRIALPG